MKEKIILDLDYNQGAFWVSGQETGEPITGIDAVDTNKEIALINKKIRIYIHHIMSLIQMVLLVISKKKNSIMVNYY